MSDVLARARYWLDSIDGAVPLERAIDYDLVSDLSAEVKRLKTTLRFILFGLGDECLDDLDSFAKGHIAGLQARAEEALDDEG